MSGKKHSELTGAAGEGIHISHQYTYATAAARTGASGFVAADIGKIAKQTDTLEWYILSATTPTWKLITGVSTIAHSATTGQTTDDHHARDHQSAHGPGGADALKLDNLEVPDDNTDLDASTLKHGLLLKLAGGTTKFLRADGTWVVPPDNDTVYTHPNHSGEVTSVGDGAQTVDKTVITNKATVAPVSGDFLLFSDTSAAGALKKLDASNLMNGVFGTEYSYVEDDTSNTTTSGTLQTLLSIDVSSKPAGDYRVAFAYVFGLADFFKSIEVEARVYTGAGFTTKYLQNDETLDKVDAWTAAGGFFKYTLGAQDTLKLMFRSVNGTTVKMKYSRLETWRIS